MTLAGRGRTARGPVALVAVVCLVLPGCGGSGSDDEQSTSSRTTAAASTSSDTSLPYTSLPSTSTTPPPPTTTAPAPAGGVPAALRGQDVEVIPTSRQVVALTFDAGANADGLPSILSTLVADGVPATFFITGQWAHDHPSQAAAITAAGHRVGNHSSQHPHFPALSEEAIRLEVVDAEDQIRASGVDPRPLFRFPFGDRDARTIKAVNDLGYVAVRWTVDTLGWKGTTGGMSAQQVSDRAVAALRPGAIVLMHVGSNPNDRTTLDADALPGMISRMRGAGYEFVTLDQLVRY